MKRLTKSMRKAITQDWLGQFPGLSEYLPMHLLRCNGPVVNGIALNCDSSGVEYRPQAHVHCLLSECPSISLTATQRLRTPRTNTQVYISTVDHCELHVSAAADMAAQWELPLTGDLRLQQVLDAYNRWMAPLGPTRYCVLEFEEMVLLCAWCGELERANWLLRGFLSQMRDWPEDVLAEIGGISDWKNILEQRMNDRKGLEATFERQLKALKLEHLPMGRLVS